MKNSRLMKKLNSRAGESIGETLVALIIASLALFMLAGAITASSKAIVKSKTQLDRYYTANENGMVRRSSGGTTLIQGVVIEDKTDAISDQSFDVSCFKNEVFSGNPVVAYKWSHTT